MGDLERIREKTTVYIDGRRIFGLFVACSLAATGIFAAGVWVGKRLAVPTAPDLEGDPLAAIDQMAAEDEVEAFSFQRGLIRGAAPPALALAAKGVDAEAPPEASDEIQAAPVSGAAERSDEEKTAKPEPAPPAAPLSPAAAAASEADPPAAEPAGPVDHRWTLQISSFPARTEADEYARTLGDKGYETYVIASEVPGRGLWYRVRIGDFATRQAAIEAKYAFEKQHHVIAYVTGR